MKKLLLFLATLPAFGLDNSKTFYNEFTGALSNHFIAEGHYFAPGEIPNYCRPFVTPSDTLVRTAAADWQCIVKTRHYDALASRTLTGLVTSNPSWANGVGGTSASISGNIITFNLGGGHNLNIGDALVFTPTSVHTDNDMKNNQPFLVHEIVNNTTVRVLHHQGSITSTAGAWTIANVLDAQNFEGMRFTSPNHGFRPGHTINCSGIGGVPEANSELVITSVTHNEFVVNKAGTGSWTGTGACTGPALGSAAHVRFALLANIPASGSIRVDFVNSGTPSSAGDETATMAAGLDKTEMLAATWNLVADFTAPVADGHGATYTFDARAVLNDWNGVQKPCGPRYWTIGPVETVFLLENGCLPSDTAAITVSALDKTAPYDFGWRMAGTGTLSQTLTTAVGTSSAQIGVSSRGEIELDSKLWIANSSGTQTGAEIMLVTNIDEAVTVCDGQTITLGTPCLNVSRQQEVNSILCNTTICPIGRIVSVWQWRDGAPPADSHLTSPHFSIRPTAQLSFRAGAGVGLRLEVFNNHWQKWQSLWYSVDIKTGATPATRKLLPTFKHAAHTSWKFDTTELDSGSDPRFYCKDQGADPEACESTILSVVGGTLSSIVVTVSQLEGVATANCTSSCGGVSAGDYITVKGAPANSFVNVALNGLNGAYIVTSATSNSFSWKTRQVLLGTYNNVELTIGRGVRHLKVRTDHNTAYMFQAGVLPQWLLLPATGMTNDWGYGHLRSDRGGVSVLRSPRTKSSWSVYRWPGRYLGTSSWGADIGQSVNSANHPYNGSATTDFPNNTQEGFVLESSEVRCINTWDISCYETIFGTSNPGGGGNSAVQGHETMQHVEDNILAVTPSILTRPYMQGFPDSSFGKPLSSFARYVYFNALTGSTGAIDRPQSACGTTPAPSLLTANNAQWPCSGFGGVFTAGDGWSINDIAHQNDRSWLPYLLTADYSYLRTMENQSFQQCSMVGTKVAAGNLFFKPWCFTEAISHLRLESMPIRHYIRLSAFYPNTPQWGQVTVPVESYYYHWQLWDLAKAEEGGAQITNGWQNIFYGFQSGVLGSLDCSFYDLSDRQNSPWHFNRCAASKYNNRANLLGWPMFAFNAGGSCGVYPTCSNEVGNSCSIMACVNGTESPSTAQWMFTYTLTVLRQSENAGNPQFKHVFRKLGTLATGIAGSVVLNKYLATIYGTVGQVFPDLSFRTSMADYRDGYSEQWPIPLNNTPPIILYDRDTSEFCHQSPTQPGGLCTTQPGAAISYANRVRSGVAVLHGINGLTTNTLDGCTAVDVPPAGCTPRQAFDRIMSFTALNYPIDPKYSLIPRETIADVAVTPNGGSVTIDYIAPSADNCTYRLANTPPDNTLDGTDTSDGQTTVGQRSIGPLSLANGTYHFRLTCGQRLTNVATGTAREETTFQVGLAPPTGLTVGPSVRFGPGVQIR